AHRGPALAVQLEGNALSKRGARRRHLVQMIQGQPERIMGFREAYGILKGRGQGEGPLCKLARPLALAAYFIILPQSNQYFKELRRVAELLTQRVCPDTDAFIVRGRLALGHA